jgi:hypothetical protein
MLSVTTSRKKRLVQIFSHFLYGQSYGCFYFYSYFVNDLIINFNHTFAILVIIGAVLIPIQTSAEEYVLGVFNARICNSLRTDGFAADDISYF